MLRARRLFNGQYALWVQSCRQPSSQRLTCGESFFLRVGVCADCRPAAAAGRTAKTSKSPLPPPASYQCPEHCSGGCGCLAGRGATRESRCAVRVKSCRCTRRQRSRTRTTCLGHRVSGPHARSSLRRPRPHFPHLYALPVTLSHDNKCHEAKAKASPISLAR